MTSSYAILATVNLLHEYYADGRCNDFEVVPTPTTVSVLKGAGILVKNIGNALILLVKVDEAGATYLKLPADLKLSFYLQLRSPAMLNYTNLPSRSDSFFYFSNAYGTSVADVLYLNKAIPDFSVTNAYNIGDLIKAGGTIYEAVKPVSKGGAPPSGDSSAWRARPAAQYVHAADLLLLSDGLVRINTLPSKTFSIAVFGRNPASGAFDIPAWTALTQSYPQDTSTIQINLGSITPGQYRLSVNGVDHWVYIDKTAVYNRVFGVIELFNAYPAGHALSFIDADQRPKGIDYTIRFANRLALWKYITRTTQVTGITLPSMPGAFIAGPKPRQFISAAPLPLSQLPLKPLQLLKGEAILTSRLANPPPDRIATHTDGSGNTYYCAEMYLNY